jgi:neutral ceramidase
LPGDVFFEIGQRIAAELGAGPACVVGYSHGYIGYVPDRGAFALGGYEVAESHRYVGLWRVSPAAEDVLQDQVRLLREMSPSVK